MPTVCFRCYEAGLKAFVNSRRYRISQVTADTYLGDGSRFARFFIEGAMKVKGNWVSTEARGVNGHVNLSDEGEFLSALVEGGMADSSATVYCTPIEGAFHFAPSCSHK
ncbi:MAG: hypothetical protein WCG62_06180 [Actinomycetes bacterium]